MVAPACPTWRRSTSAGSPPRDAAGASVGRRARRQSRGRRADPALPQPARLRAAHPAALRLSLPMSQLHGWMVEHRFTRRLACHIAARMPAPTPARVQGGDSLVACAPASSGSPTVKSSSPTPARDCASDTSVTGQSGRVRIANEAHEIDIVIGTNSSPKAIISPASLWSRGHADLGLAAAICAPRTHLPSNRQVSGRAGRGTSTPSPRPDPRSQCAGHAGPDRRRRGGLLRRRDRCPPRGGDPPFVA